MESVISFGIWETEEIDAAVKNLSKTQAVAALKAQIRLRIDVLQCVSPCKVRYSKFTQEEFVQYLKELIHVKFEEDKKILVQVISDLECLVGMKFNQKWLIDARDEMCSGMICQIKDGEYECMFNGEEIFQTVAEMLADTAVGDIFLYIS